MKILEREYSFMLTVKARRDIRALCPGGDIGKLGEYLDGSEMEEKITGIILLLNKGHEDYKAFWEAQNGRTYEPVYLTEELIENLDMEDYRELEAEAMEAFRRGMGITVEAEEPKETGKGKKSAADKKQN